MLKAPLHWCRIARYQIVGHGFLAKTLTVQSHIQLVELERLRLPRTEDTDVVRQCQRSGDLAFRIMIAVQNEDRDTGLIESPHLLGKEQSGLVITPTAVIEVTGDHEKIHLLLNRPFD